MKRTLVVTSALLACVFSVLVLTDFFGFLPTLPRVLGGCNVGAFKHTANIKRNEDKGWVISPVRRGCHRLRVILV